MEDSKKLPTIQVGDTVVFRTDLKEGVKYGGESFQPPMVKFTNSPQKVNESNGFFFTVCNDSMDWFFTPEMVAEVIKPTKERMYSEEEINELIKRIEAMKDDSGRKGCTYGDTDFDSLSAVYGYNTAISNIIEVIQSLNK